ncbi:MAG: hypothetical protein GY811_10155 [Myxococcales bacterium]|nr:hypothetical protein [Myxococcales bacterium]
MQFDYPHSVGLEDARARVDVLCIYLRNRHGIKVNWNGNTGSFDGKYLMVTIQGKMQIEDAQIHFDGKDPGMLWRKKAVEYLKEKLAVYLDPNTPIAELPTDKS